MAESSNSNRIRFRKGEQGLFIKNCQAGLKLRNTKLAKLLRVSVRTLADWKREKYSLSQEAADFLTKKSKIELPKNTKTLEQYWYTTKGAKIAGKLVYQKYGRVGGDPEYRKRKWREWWEQDGKFIHHPIINNPKPIGKPRLSVKLAEFVGIMIGDGGITPAQVIVSLNSIDDLDYSRFVSKLEYQLFGTRPKINFHKKFQLLRVIISRVELVRFCKEIGLHVGNKLKQGLDMPLWIKESHEFKKACLRGLFDTDGCLVIHKYRVNGKLYTYKKLNFSSASPPLIKSTIKILGELGFCPRLSRNGRNIWIDGQKEVKRYLGLIGSSNPKHLRRYKN